MQGAAVFFREERDEESRQAGGETAVEGRVLRKSHESWWVVLSSCQRSVLHACAAVRAFNVSEQRENEAGKRGSRLKAPLSVQGAAAEKGRTSRG
ncbi:hypothetical protein FGB62_29g120 [Gracilaria domingensis]|nr:hypothetical protein FGB62_29g120 [Gracilaria domingensis]